MNVFYASRTRQRGLTLIELMVAILLGLFLIAGTISIFISNKQSYTAQNDMGRIQETGRFAMDMVVRDVRMAGYFGCVNNMGTDAIHNVLNAMATPGSLLNTTYAIEGLDSTAATPSWLPSSASLPVTGESASYGGTNLADMVANNDAITIRHAAGLTWPLNADMSSPTQAVPINANPTSPTPSPTGGSATVSTSTFSQNQIAVISNCSEAHVFAISGAPTPALPHAAGAAFYQNSSGGLDYYQQSQVSLVMPLVAVRYYICNDNATPPDAGFQPALCQTSYDPTTQTIVQQPVLDGVESMHITYGIDTDGNSQVDSYVTGVNVPNWNQVLSVKIGLLVRSIRSIPSNPVDANNYDVNGYTFTAPGDRRKRRVFESIIYLRNSNAF